MRYLMKEETLAFGVEPSRSKYRLRLARYPALAEKIAAYVRTIPEGQAIRLLDVGLGHGRSRRYLEPHGLADRVQFFGIDIDPKRLELVHRRDQWRLVQGNVDHGLPYGSEYFDMVVCEQVLEHLNKPREVVKEIARVLKPGGLFIAGVPNFAPGFYSIRRHIVPWLDKIRGFDRGHEQVFGTRSIRKLIEGSGELKVQSIRGFRFMSDLPLVRFDRFRWWWKLNGAFGKVLPSLCIEIQIVSRKDASH
jgi:SAM-dependent methyltransferase